MLLTIATIDHNTTERKPKLHTTNNCHVPPTYRTPPPIVKSKWACYGSRVQRRRAGVISSPDCYTMTADKRQNLVTKSALTSVHLYLTLQLLLIAASENLAAFHGPISINSSSI
ncbi:hypothetical protein T10_13052 [Trichinella papuae]|uniref:Uncharacterized protein n=1 Tax=Trichinella papuae TaxID=268474 RepID=A0A0V1MQF5_9BILA|nr:hypothetical protein T10_13052 [Trichinella papuae]